MKKFVLILASLFVAVPVNAAVVLPITTTTNQDIDTAAEALWSTGPVSCAEVKICNGAATNDVIAYTLSSSALTSSLASNGFRLYPTEASGPVCDTLVQRKSETTGKSVPINTRTIYVSTVSGIDSSATVRCVNNAQSER